MDTKVMRTVAWVFLGLGCIGLVVFALNPDIHAVPQAALLAITGLVGSGMLHGLARLLGDRID